MDEMPNKPPSIPDKTELPEVEKNLSDEKTEHKFSHLYKTTNKALQANPEQKREAFLIEHKEKQSERFDEQRDLEEIFVEKEIYDQKNSADPTMIVSADDDTHQEAEPMEDSLISREEEEFNAEGKSIREANRKKRRSRKMKFNLNMNHWFYNIPEDLSDRWLVKLCPEGSRRILITEGSTVKNADGRYTDELEGITKCFDRTGVLLFQFKSGLPGGGKKSSGVEKAGVTVLDCIYETTTKTFFILDLIVWNRTSFLDCDAEFRHYFLKLKYDEEPRYFENVFPDSYPFKLIEHYPADLATIQREVCEYQSRNGVLCHGVIFFHKESPYHTEDSNLVTWLRVFMLPEKLNINIPPEYEAMKPQGYVDSATFIQKCLVHREFLKKKREEEQQKLKESEEKMQCVEEQEEKPKKKKKKRKKNKKKQKESAEMDTQGVEEVEMQPVVEVGTPKRKRPTQKMPKKKKPCVEDVEMQSSEEEPDAGKEDPQCSKGREDPQCSKGKK